MFDRKLFDGYPQETRQFYAQMFFVLTLNQVAWRQGLFDTLLSDTDDVYTWMRFYDLIPELKERLGLKLE